jgi:hypothetical protein
LFGSAVTDVKDALALDAPPATPAEPMAETHVEALQHSAAATNDIAAEPAAQPASDKAP